MIEVRFVSPECVVERRAFADPDELFGYLRALYDRAFSCSEHEFVESLGPLGENAACPL